MAEDGKIIYRVEADDSGFAEKVGAAGKRGGSFLSEAMTGAARAVGEAFVSMASKAIDGVEQIVKAGIDFNAKMETYKTAFTTLTGSAEEAARIMSQIREDAAATPFDVDSLTQANQLLIAAGVDADSARTDVLNLANAIAATGGGSAELSRMAQNMQQIKNVGKATAMDIRQFANAGINIYKLLADAQGISVEKASELEVTYEMLSDAMAKAAESGGIYEDALYNQSQTFNGRISTLKDNWQQLTGLLTEDLFDRLSGEALPMVSGWLDSIMKGAEEGGISGAIAAAGEIVSQLLASLVEKAPEMVSAGMKMITNFIKGIRNNIGRGQGAIKELMIAILEAIAENLPDLILAGIDLVLALVEGFISAIPDMLSAAGSLLSQLWDALSSVDFSGIGSRIVNAIKSGISGAWGGLKSWFKGLLSGLSSSSVEEIAPGATGGGDSGGSTSSGGGGWHSTTESPALNAAPPGFDNFFDGGQAYESGIERNDSYNISNAGRPGSTTITIPLFIDSQEVARATAVAMGEQLAWEEF